MTRTSFAPGFFDLSSPELFFDAIRRAAEDLAASEFKRTEQLMFVVMGLNHLRDWIAPGQRASSPEREFYKRIYSLDEYRIIKALCNHSKHLDPFAGSLSMPPPTPIDEWPDVNSVSNFDQGPPPGYAVDGRDVMDIIEEVVRFYDKQWFSRQQTTP